jgi:hypothetical protein
MALKYKEMDEGICMFAIPKREGEADLDRRRDAPVNEGIR